MMRALYSAISGMKNQMSFMDVVGNNIANVNTIAYKSSRVTFQDILGQTIKGASSPQNGRGGTNPAQIGLGMNLGGIDTVMTQGSIQSTGKLTDFAIQGDGFFVVSDGQRNYYTRDGAFDIGVDGGLVNPVTGLRVMGWTADATGAVDTQTSMTALEIPFGTQVSAQPSSNMRFSGNLDASVPVGGYVNTTVTAYDSLGVAHSVKLTLTKMAPNMWAVRDSASSVAFTPAPTGDLAAAGASVTGSPNTMRPGKWDVTLTAGTLSAQFTPATFTPPSTWGTGTPEAAITGSLAANGTNTTLIPGVTFTAGAAAAAGTATIEVAQGATSPAPVEFSPNGQWLGTNTNPTVTLDNSNTGASTPQTVTLDLTTLTQFAGQSQVNLTTNDGFPAGALVSFSVGSSGEVSGIYSNGSNRVIGQLALANFVNAGGLQRSGQNLWTPTGNSGDAILGTPNSNGRGTVNTGTLEGSNVDLAQQFTNVIIAQRGFQSSARVVTASDQMLQDLVAIIR
ncbi:MAG: flagellar hook protein FlgE [Chloroflexi bacterium]|nr:flagellar hook protein FlgE [Chloroflexota bacterium]